MLNTEYMSLDVIRIVNLAVELGVLNYLDAYKLTEEHHMDYTSLLYNLHFWSYANPYVSYRTHDTISREINSFLLN